MTAVQPISIDLAAIRAIVVAELDQAMRNAQRLASPDVSMPPSLLAACMWLADRQEFAATEAEEYFGWTPAKCLRFLYGLSPEARAEEIARGHRVLFEGNSRRAPLVDTSLTECARDPGRRVLKLNFGDRRAAA